MQPCIRVGTLERTDLFLDPRQVVDEQRRSVIARERLRVTPRDGQLAVDGFEPRAAPPRSPARPGPPLLDPHAARLPAAGEPATERGVAMDLGLSDLRRTAEGRH